MLCRTMMEMAQQVAPSYAAPLPEWLSAEHDMGVSIDCVRYVEICLVMVLVVAITLLMASV